MNRDGGEREASNWGRSDLRGDALSLKRVSPRSVAGARANDGLSFRSLLKPGEERVKAGRSGRGAADRRAGGARVPGGARGYCAELVVCMPHLQLIQT